MSTKNIYEIGQCDYCGSERFVITRPTPFAADAGEMMCRQCWCEIQKEYKDSIGEVIPNFDSALGYDQIFKMTKLVRFKYFTAGTIDGLNIHFNKGELGIYKRGEEGECLVFQKDIDEWVEVPENSFVHLTEDDKIKVVEVEHREKGSYIFTEEQFETSINAMLEQDIALAEEDFDKGYQITMKFKKMTLKSIKELPDFTDF